jgi:glycosyltransferase involved in cell wall biosynthesis
VPATLLVATETHFVRTTDGRFYSTTGIDGYGFWTRYLDVFDRVVVAARTWTVQDSPAAPRVDGPGVDVAALPDYRGPWEYLRTRLALGTAIRRAIAGADALCLRAPGPIAGLAWRFRNGRPYGVEVVGDPLDALSPGAVRSAARPVARTVLARDLRAMCREAEAVSYVTTRVLQHRYPARGWSTSYSSIQLDADAFVGENDVRQRYDARTLHDRGTPNNPWRLICVGSLTQLYKGIDVAIDALVSCRARGMHAALSIVGDGAERRRLEEYARMRGVASSVTFYGLVPATRVRALLDAGDIFVLPSRTEGLPRGMVEAMARGVVCVGTAIGGIPELLPDSRMVRQNDPDGLAATLVGLCSAPEGLVGVALADLSTALRYQAGTLRPRRVACYSRIRAAIKNISGTLPDKRQLRLHD